MAFIDWTDSLSVNYRLLDADHRRFIEFLNKLYDASHEGHDHQAAVAAMNMLVDFTKTHFIHEETLMRKTAYPQFIPHKIEHDRLLKQIEDFRQRYAAGQVGLSRDTVVFLRGWLCDHIVKVDVHLGRWLAKHAPSAQG